MKNADKLLDYDYNKFRNGSLNEIKKIASPPILMGNGGKCPTMSRAAKFRTCLRRMGLAPEAPPWLRPIASQP